MIVLGPLLIVFFMLLASCLVVVPQTKVYVVERMGRFYAKWEAGVHLKMPILDHVVKKVSLKEQVLDFPPQRVITKDNVTISIDSIVFMKVFDPKLYAYGVENPILGVESLTATTLRNQVGMLDLDQALTSRDTINSEMEKILDEATDAWGIKVTRVEVKDIQPPQNIQDVMLKQMTAERKKRQAILESEAHKSSIVTRAEGDRAAKVMEAEAERDAAIARAEGEAKAIKLVYDAEAEGLRRLSEIDISPAVLQLKQLDALKAIGDGNATKIFVPTDIAGSVINMAVAGDALDSGREKASKKPVQPPAAKPDPCVDGESSDVTKNAAKQGGYASDDEHEG